VGKFGIDIHQLIDPQSLIAALSHEVAHAYLQLHGLVEDDREVEEKLTDLTAVYLGFDIFVVNATERYRKSGYVAGILAIKQWSVSSGGYLDTPSLCLLFAAHTSPPGAKTRIHTYGSLNRTKPRTCGVTSTTSSIDGTSVFRHLLGMSNQLSNELEGRMITIRCTEKAAKAGVSPNGSGAWRHKPAGRLVRQPYRHGRRWSVSFVNEQSLLAVIVPRHEMKSMNVFVARVGNLLSMIGLANERIHEEIQHFTEARAGKTVSKRVIGVMNDLAARCQERIEEASPQSKE
jgi:hypothetical protein